MSDHHHDHAGHDHSIKANQSNSKRLWIALGLIFIYMLAEAVGGLWSNSLALLADASHMLTDVAAIGLALFASWFARQPATNQKTYGFYRAEILAAFINAISLLGISVYIFWESVQRFEQAETINGPLMIGIATGGIVINILAAWVLNGGEGKSLNQRSVLLHIITDLIGTIGTVVAGLLVWKMKWHLADPILGVLIAGGVILSGWKLLNEALNVLLEGVPKDIQITEIQETLNSILGVSEVHDLHVWAIATDKVSLTTHLVIAENQNPQRILDEVRAILVKQFKITHTTVQIESENCQSGELNCHLGVQATHD